MGEDGPEPPDEGPSLVADEPPPGGVTGGEAPSRDVGLPVLTLFTLGVVYGDIGTSPIYALRESFHGRDAVPVTSANVLGVLSLILWSLLLVVSLKYLFYVLRAENEGEGGVLALAALLDPWARKRTVFAFLGVFGAALLYGDGAITPAISVLSAVEGLAVAAPGTEGWVIPISVAILVLLFAFQRRGTTGVGAVFGPVMAVWFVTLAVLGVGGIVREPSVLAAWNPAHGVRFFLANGLDGYLVLGAVFLVVTGGEALYADLGHFGKAPIRLGWFAVVLPALLLNYFGQGALLLGGAGGGQPFYGLAPGWALYPLVGLATLATVIASQAVISGVFSLTRQAVQLGISPRFQVRQTSSDDIGRVYLPAVNAAMMVTTVGLVLGFRSSSALAGAYGVAISTTFVITTVLAHRVARERWGWPAPAALAVTGGFLVLDLAFLGANVPKVPEGGWFPLVLAGLVWFLMDTWASGRRLLTRRLDERTETLDEVLRRIEADGPPRVPGTAVFLSSRPDRAPPTLGHHLARNGALHETVLILTVRTSNVPRVHFRNRLEVVDRGGRVYRVVAHKGFMQRANVPVLVEACRRLDVPVSPGDEVTYYVGRDDPVPVQELGMVRWRALVFAFLVRNAPRAEAAFHIPPEQVVELGIPVEI